MSATAEAHVNVKDALDHARAAAQELHGALSDAVAEHGEAITSDLEALPLKAEAIADSIRTSLDAQAAATKLNLGEAVAYLGATATHTTQALKCSGHAAEQSIRQAIGNARAAVQSISEAVAAKRSAASTHK